MSLNIDFSQIGSIETIITDHNHVTPNNGVVNIDGVTYTNKCLAISIAQGLKIPVKKVIRALRMNKDEEFNEDKHGKYLKKFCENFGFWLLIHYGERLKSGNIAATIDWIHDYPCKEDYTHIVHIIQYNNHFEFWWTRENR